MAGVFLLTLLGGAIGYYWITTGWAASFSEEQMKGYAQQVNSSPDLPASFYEIYDKLHQEQRLKTMNEDLLQIAQSAVGVSNHLHACECRQVFWELGINHNIGLKENSLISNHPDYFFAWGIQKFSSPKKCFDFNINSFVREFKNESGAKALSELLKTPFAEMSEDEILEFTLLMQAPVYYDKYRNSERFETKMSDLKERLKKPMN